MDTISFLIAFGFGVMVGWIFMPDMSEKSNDMYDEL